MHPEVKTFDRMLYPFKRDLITEALARKVILNYADNDHEHESSMGTNRDSCFRVIYEYSVPTRFVFSAN